MKKVKQDNLKVNAVIYRGQIQTCATHKRYPMFWDCIQPTLKNHTLGNRIVQLSNCSSYTQHGVTLMGGTCLNLPWRSVKTTDIY
jgi:hypothetical protein